MALVSIAPEQPSEPPVLHTLLRDDLPFGVHTPEADAMSLALCSGVVLEGGRRILTTATVAGWGTRLTVSAEGIRPVAANLVGVDRNTHLALLATDQRLPTPLAGPGDLITAVDNAPVTTATLRLLAAGLRGGERLWPIRVERQGAAFYLATTGLETVP